SFFFQAEDGIRDFHVTGVQTCALPISKRVLVIGAETFSRILDWTDRTTCVLFGDGAGAIVLEAQEGAGTNADRGVLSTQLRSDRSEERRGGIEGSSAARYSGLDTNWYT